ncbi:hypothetical protein FDP41_006133 [Naegleria fowleri]|uniref:Uncharacterized protein n=1 Tax=Naegleria fowleri TaxID=5763 RepID=A0A6A5BP22_NAEFO|nr:uncharacterized protein FDP41_006133 [Naegleria fowleri]KAF0974659.1 hypothetical protein FDP41_006133 [Naegleria fowleri]CAG4710250.1 unnamed protein product [Naegleria fowleri]
MTHPPKSSNVPNVNQPYQSKQFVIHRVSKQQRMTFKRPIPQKNSFTFVQNTYQEGIGVTCINFQHKNSAKHISKYDLIKVLHLSQPQACKVLNCSMSTLKRKFYQMKNELGMDKWPQYFQEVRHLPIFEYMYPMSLNFILNHDGHEEGEEENNNKMDLSSISSSSLSRRKVHFSEPQKENASSFSNLPNARTFQTDNHSSSFSNQNIH